MKRSQNTFRLSKVVPAALFACTLALAPVSFAYATDATPPNAEPPAGFVPEAEGNANQNTTDTNNNGQVQGNTESQTPNAQPSAEEQAQAKAAEEARKKAEQQEKQRQAAKAAEAKKAAAKKKAEEEAKGIKDLADVNETKTASDPLALESNADSAVAVAQNPGGSGPNLTALSPDVPAEMQGISWGSNTPGYWWTSPVVLVAAAATSLLLLIGLIVSLLLRSRYAKEAASALDYTDAAVGGYGAQAYEAAYDVEEVQNLQEAYYNQEPMQAQSVSDLEHNDPNLRGFDTINPGDTFIDHMRIKFDKNK
ncbi:MAG: hypothetical protein Q4E22_03735 [Coriobacteriia bacterium]|nr:hypothetical protein [Coriobacteriia bacterium]